MMRVSPVVIVVAAIVVLLGATCSFPLQPPDDVEVMMSFPLSLSSHPLHRHHRVNTTLAVVDAIVSAAAAAAHCQHCPQSHVTDGGVAVPSPQPTHPWETDNVQTLVPVAAGTVADGTVLYQYRCLALLPLTRQIRRHEYHRD